MHKMKQHSMDILLALLCLGCLLLGSLITIVALELVPSLRVYLQIDQGVTNAPTTSTQSTTILGGYLYTSNALVEYITISTSPQNTLQHSETMVYPYENSVSVYWENRQSQGTVTQNADTMTLTNFLFGAVGIYQNATGTLSDSTLTMQISDNTGIQSIAFHKASIDAYNQAVTNMKNSFTP